jgi:transposase
VSLSSEKNTTRITKILAEEGINVSRTSVSKFLKRYRKSGSLLDTPRSGRKSKLYEEHLTFIDENMKANDELISEELRKLISKECGLDISSKTRMETRKY